jgi:Cu(I)/Ag(I) efflux system membrane protein CusA/SilA
VIPAIFGLVKGFGLPSEDRFDSQPPLPPGKPIERPRRVPQPAE